MTDREAMRLALEAISALLYNDMNRVEIAMNAIAALRQALEQPEPSMGLIPSEWAGLEKSDIPVDRGVWSDVPDATKWVDELRGDEPWDTSDMAYRPNGLNMEQEPVGEIVNAFGDLTAVSIPEMPPVGTKLYTAPPRREWVGLNYVEVRLLTVFDGLYHVETLVLDKFIRAIEAKLKEKNT